MNFAEVRETRLRALTNSHASDADGKVELLCRVLEDVVAELPATGPGSLVRTSTGLGELESLPETIGEMREAMESLDRAAVKLRNALRSARMPKSCLPALREVEELLGFEV
jgi:hypothetical protein